MLRNTKDSYGLITKSIHWIVFFLLVFAVFAGYNLASMPNGPEKMAAAGTHKSFGVLILALITLRLIWRLLNPTPAPIAGTSPREHTAATAMHWVLYALMFSQPMSGVLMSQAAGVPVQAFGLFELPTLIESSKSTAGLMRNVHGTVWILLALAVLGHALAALFHHFVRKDNVLRRMTTMKAQPLHSQSGIHNPADSNSQ